MKKQKGILLFSIDATLYDGTVQLPGKLEIWEHVINFEIKDFKTSHLNLCIPFSTIVKVEIFLVYNLARNGLRIRDMNGRQDMFVLDDVDSFKKVLLSQMDKLGINL